MDVSILLQDGKSDVRHAVVVFFRRRRGGNQGWCVHA